MAPWLAAGASLLAMLGAVPAGAAVRLVSGVAGTVVETDDVTDYSICDGNEEYCETLPFGGRYQTARRELTLDQSGGRYRVGGSQRSDEGGPLSFAFTGSARFVADNAVRVYLSEVIDHDIGRRWPCSGCTHFALGSIWTTPLGSGRWAIDFEAFSDASMRAGEQTLGHLVTFRIAEVPEPATWAMLVAGFGLVGAAARRSRAAARG